MTAPALILLVIFRFLSYSLWTWHYQCVHVWLPIGETLPWKITKHHGGIESSRTLHGACMIVNEDAQSIKKVTSWKYEFELYYYYYCNFACHAEWAHLRLLVSQSQSQLTASMALPRDNGLSQFSLSLIITSPFCMHALER